ncbi:hypothetical protein Vretifemale_391, partial [Volvox reticuliferus]
LRTKPLGDSGEELFVFPFWSGKDMIKSKLHGQFPEVYKTAVALARMDQETQNHAHKLEDPGRLVALLLVSPDALAHQHKSDFEGKAYELFCKSGPSAGQSYRPSSDEQPRLMTYVWPKDVEESVGDAGGDAIGRGRRGRRSSAAMTAASPRRPPPLPRLGQAGWYEDLAGGWAAQQLLGAFRSWYLTDEDGHLVPPTMLMELTDLGLEEPHGFNLSERGMKECGDKYAYGEADPVETGEMLMVINATQKRGDDVPGAAGAAGGGAGGGGASRPRSLAGHARIAQKFFIEGTDASKQHYALVRPWRPHWSPLAPLLSESIMELQPLNKGGRRVMDRKAEQQKLVRTWEEFLPRRLAVEPDEEMGALRSEYDNNHTFNRVTVFIAGNSSSSQSGAGGGGGGGGGGSGCGTSTAAGAGGGTVRRGRPSKASQATASDTAGAGVEPSGESLPPYAPMNRTESHYPKYTVSVSLLLEAWERTASCSPGDDDRGRWVEVANMEAPFVAANDKRKFTFTGFDRYLRKPGTYRMKFLPRETAVELLDPKQPLEHVFKVTSSQPVVLNAFFVAPTLVGPDPLTRQPVVRLGEPLPDMAVALMDARGARVAFPSDLRARLESTWDPAAAAAAGLANTNSNSNSVGGGSSHPLTVAAEVFNGDPIRLKLSLLKRSGSAAAGSGGRSAGLSLSPDNMMLFISGLYVKPTALKQTTGGGRKATAASVNVRLRVTLATTASGQPLSTDYVGAHAAVGDDAAGSADRGAAAAGGHIRDILLVSGQPHSINVENGNWFNSTTLDRPLPLSKGAVLDNDLVIRLVDANGNPFYLIGETRPRVALRCSHLGGIAVPPVMVRKQAAPPGGVGAEGGRGGGARSEFVESTEVEMDSSGNFLTLHGSMIKATGLPGEIGTLTLSLVESGRGAGGGRCSALMSYISVRKVVLGIEEIGAAEGDGNDGNGNNAQANAGGTRRPRRRARSRFNHAHTREYLLDGTVKVKTRREPRWADLEVEEEGKSLLEMAFERRVEFTSSGPREVFLRPSGVLLRSQAEVLAAARTALVSPGVSYEQCFVLRPGQFQLGGLRLSLSEETDDVVDEHLTADVRILIGSREVVSRLRVDKGRAELPELTFQEKDFAEAENAVVAVSVWDAYGRGSGAGASAAAAGANTDRPAGAAAGAVFCYGTFYVRQEPHAVALRLAPLSCDLLTHRRAVTPWPPPQQPRQAASPNPTFMGVLQMPTIPAAAETTTAVVAAPPAATVGRQRAAARGGGEVASSAGGGGGVQPLPGTPQLLLQLLVPNAATGRSASPSVVDAAALMARGFSLAAESITLQAGQTLRVPLVAVDQMGFPLAVPPALTQLLEQYTTAYLEPVQDAAGAARVAATATSVGLGHGRGGGASGGAGAGGAGGRAAGHGRLPAGVGREAGSGSSIVPCEISGWTWQEVREDVEGSGAAAGDAAAPGTEAPAAPAGAQQLPRLPVCYFQVQPMHSSGHAALIVTFDPPPDALNAVATAGAAAAELKVLPRLHMGLALHFQHGPLAAAGYQLSVLAPQGVQAQPISEHPERDVEMKTYLPAPRNCQRMYKLEVVEKTELVLELRLMDAQGFLVEENGTFELRYVEVIEQERYGGLHVQPCTVTHGSLKLTLPVCAGSAWVTSPVLLLLVPSSPNFIHAEPLCIYLFVRRGRYPVEPLELVWPECEQLPPRDRVLMLTLPNEDLPVRGRLERHGNADEDSAPAFQWPHLPPFQVVVHSADGMKLEADELQPLRLYYARKVQVDGGIQLQEATDLPVTQLQPREAGVSLHRAHFYAAPGAVEIPTRTGQIWTLMAEYQDPRVSSPGNRLGPTPVLDLELLPAPPFRIQLCPASEAALGHPGSRPLQTVVVANEALGDYKIPEIGGQVVDRWGNASKPGSDHFMLLIVRPSTAVGSASSPEDTFIELASCEVESQDGSFCLGPTPLGTAGLTPGSDYEVYLQLWYEGAGGSGGGAGAGGGEQMAEGEANGGASPVRGVELLVQTLYVSLMGDSAALRTKVQQLEAEAAKLEQQLRSATSDERARRRALGEAAGQYSRVLAQLQDRGVRLPATTTSVIVRGQAAEADIMAASAADYERLLVEIEACITSIDQHAGQLMRPPLVEPGAIARWTPPQQHHQAAAPVAMSMCLMPFMKGGNMGHPTHEAARIYDRLRQMAMACVGLPGALGPLVMLGAVEKCDVAIALGQLAGGRFERVFVTDDKALRELLARLSNMRPGGSATDLCDPVLLSRYDLDPNGVDVNHPQLPLLKRPLRSRFQAVLDFEPPAHDTDAALAQAQSRQQQQQQQQSHRRPAEDVRSGNPQQRNCQGFIGFAVNLVHLPPHLAEIRVPVRDHQGRSLQQGTLRQTMLNYVFGNAMVFEKEEHIHAFRDRCRRVNIFPDVPLIAVDGKGGYNLGDKGSVSFGERTVPPICFSGLSPAEMTQLSQDGLHGGALDLRLRAEQFRLCALHSRKAQLQALRPQIDAAYLEVRAKQQLAEQQAAQQRALQERLVPQLGELRNELQSCTTEMERVAQRERFQAAQLQGSGAGARGCAGTNPGGRRGMIVRLGRGPGTANCHRGLAEPATAAGNDDAAMGTGAGAGPGATRGGSGLVSPEGEEPRAKKPRLGT